MTRQPRVIIYDSMYEEKYNKFKRIEGVNNLANVLKENRPIFRVAYNWDGKLDQQEDFDYVCRLIFECKNVVFMVEEISLYCSPSYIPKPLAKIISLGRHKDLSLYCTSQTPKQINILIRSQASEIVSFTQTEPAHIQWCKEVMGENAEQLKTLKPFHSLHWTNDGNCIIRNANFSPLDKRERVAVEYPATNEEKGIDEKPNDLPDSIH